MSESALSTVRKSVFSVDRFLAGGLDEVMGVVLADFFGQRHGHGFRHDQAAGRVKIGAHACGIDFQPFGDIGNGGERA